MFTALAQDHVRNPRNVGQLEMATHYGVAGVPGEGPFVEIWLRIEGDLIVEATYRTFGCPTTIASSSLAVFLAKGRSPDTAKLISPEDLCLLVGQIPEGKEDCPPRVISALRSALG